MYNARKKSEARGQTKMGFFANYYKWLKGEKVPLQTEKKDLQGSAIYHKKSPLVTPP